MLKNLKFKPKKDIITYVKYIPDIFIFIALGSITINNVINKFFNIKLDWFNSIDVLKNLAAPLILFLVILMLRLFNEVKNEIKPLKKKNLGLIEILDPNEEIPYKKLLKKSNNIKVLTLSGSIVFPLDDEEIQTVLFSPKRITKIIILIANPFAAMIQERYNNDEASTREAGIDIIKDRIIWLYNIAQELQNKSNYNLEIKLYNNYPTISIFNADNLIYSSHYAYKLRDKDTPTICADINEDYGKSILKHFDKVYQDAESIYNWLIKNYDNLNNCKNKLKFFFKYSGIFLQEKDSGKIILQRRDKKSNIENPGKLSVFGGNIKNNEEAIDTAIRELYEETGLKPRKEEFIFLMELPYLNNSNEFTLCSYYIVKNVDSNQIELHEGSAKENYSIEEALKLADITEYPKMVMMKKFSEFEEKK